eukprot:5127679-Amphidinium_carterae.1
MLGYGGMLMPGLSHASQPQLPQPGDASQMAGRTLHPKKKALPLVDGEASPKAKATKNGKAARKPSLKYTRLEMIVNSRATTPIKMVAPLAIPDHTSAQEPLFLLLRAFLVASGLPHTV